MIDNNHDGRVTLYIHFHYFINCLFRDEFVMKYLETRQRLTDRLNEVCKKITEHKRQRDEMAQKLNQVKATE